MFTRLTQGDDGKQCVKGSKKVREIQVKGEKNNKKEA